jgi:peptidoglycan hydrolase-like protein with peptidoglycan-binding domain
MALSLQQVRAAVAFNIRRSFDVELIRRIQGTVGAATDGVFGPATVRAVAQWQLAHNLEQDGKVGHVTLAALQAAWDAAGEDPMGLSPREIARALNYNRARGYASALVSKIQHSVSVVETGEFDEETVIAIARWQADCDLFADGKVGPNTLRAFEASWKPKQSGRTDYKIHPGIGIARLGDSPTEFFIGPEAPGRVAPEQPPQRDATGFIKRQAARFRVYGYHYDAAGKLVEVHEVTPDRAQVIWTVQLVNRKAASAQFPVDPKSPRRNAAIDEASLVIDAGAQTLSGAERHLPLQGFFLGAAVRLGDLRTDAQGRLLVLGGHGVSRAPGGEPIDSFANNDGWHDDVSDGPVTARVVLASGETVDAESAWAVVAPPRYAPEIHNVVTWWDQAFDVATRLQTTLTASQPSFTDHIYPILERASKLAWVSRVARNGHGPNATWNFLAPERLAQLASSSPETRALREKVSQSLRRPDSSAGNMPLLNSGVDPNNPQEGLDPMLTKTQLAWMAQWALGVFTADWTGKVPAAPAFEAISVASQPAALDRAALEACIGGPFYPGIEVGYVMARLDTYRAPFRIATTHHAGYLTAGLAVPWQADFSACGERWWPAQRPVSVFRGDSTTATDWTDASMTEMVTEWANLGFIRREGERYVERERIEPEPNV